MKEEKSFLCEKGVSYLRKKDRKLAWLIDQIGEISYIDNKDDFQFLTEQIISQMLSIGVADIMIRRLSDLCGGEIKSDVVCSLSIDELRNIGISARKAECILQIASMMEVGVLDLKNLRGLSDMDIMNFLTSIKGIGSWTAKMYLYKLGRPNVLPYEDATFLSAYKWLYNTENVKVQAIIHRCKKWSPYSSIATMYLYAAFDRRLTDTKSPRLKDLKYTER